MFNSGAQYIGQKAGLSPEDAKTAANYAESGANILVGGWSGARATGWSPSLGGGTGALIEIETAAPRMMNTAVSAEVNSGRVSGGTWLDDAGNILWPPNNGGVLGTEKNVVLTKGYQFDRYGYDAGSNVSPVGTPYEMRSLAPGTEAKPYKLFEVVKPVRGEGSIIEPWFDQPGGGIGFKLETSIEKLLELKRIKEVK